MKQSILKNKMSEIVCDHCHKRITSPALVGLTLVCPYCKKSVNGQYYHDFIASKKITSSNAKKPIELVSGERYNAV